jgi:hypothetical protein
VSASDSVEFLLVHQPYPQILDYSGSKGC